MSRCRAGGSGDHEDGRRPGSLVYWLVTEACEGSGAILASGGHEEPGGGRGQADEAIQGGGAGDERLHQPTRPLR